jgi:hypothetical protein
VLAPNGGTTGPLHSALGTTALVTSHAGRRASWIVAFPEAVALAAILTDLDLCRHIALERDDRPLYRRISAADHGAVGESLTRFAGCDAYGVQSARRPRPVHVPAGRSARLSEPAAIPALTSTNAASSP